MIQSPSPVCLHCLRHNSNGTRTSSVENSGSFGSSAVSEPMRLTKLPSGQDQTQTRLPRRPYRHIDVASRLCHNRRMCGRYRLSRRKQIIAEHFDADPPDDDWVPRYNIAPTQPVPVIRQHPKEPTRVLTLMRWGLIPSWSKGASGAARMINTRSETAHTLPAFREPMKFRRCLIPADGFYEWRRTGAMKRPFCFEVNDGELFAFAGLWDRWKDPSGQWVKSCSILTTTPNALTSPVHDRMPVILSRDDYELWLDPGMSDVSVVSQFLRPFDACQMRAYAVSSRVNRIENDDAECGTRVELEATPQPGLFS